MPCRTTRTTRSTDEERDIKAKYDKVKGLGRESQCLREGNSDRRAPKAVKTYAQKHPHSMGPWTSDSLARVASMSEGDFYGSEQSVTMTSASTVDIVHVDETGERTVLKEGLSLQAGEIVDCAAHGHGQTVENRSLAEEIDNDQGRRGPCSRCT